MSVQMKVFVYWCLFSFAVLIGLPGAEGRQNMEHNNHRMITQEDYPEQKIVQFWSTGEQGVFSATDGIQISYYIFPRSSATVSVTIVNGRTESYIKYQQVAYELYQAGYAVYLYDHRGQGFSQRLLNDRESDKEKGYVERFDDYVQDLKTLHRLKIAQEKYQKNVILAHSMGATVALLYALKYPKNVHAMALSSPMLGLNGSWFLCPLAKSLNAIDKLLKRSPDYAPSQTPYHKPEFQANTPAMMTHSQTYYQRTKQYEQRFPQIRLGGATTHWLAEACKAMAYVQNHGIKLSIPLLILQAGEDGVVSATAQREFYHRIADEQGAYDQSNQTLQIIPGAYHELLLEEDHYRLRVMTAIFDFLEKLR